MGEKRSKLRSLHWAWSTPGRVAWLWLVSTILCIVNAVLFPNYGAGGVRSVLFMAGTPVFAGLLASWAMRFRASTFGMVAILCSVQIGSIILEMAQEYRGVLTSDNAPAVTWVDWWVALVLPLCCASLLIWFAYAHRSKIRRLAAILLVLIANICMVVLGNTDSLFWQASAKVQALMNPGATDDDDEAPDPMAGIEQDRLWEAQSALLMKETGALQPRIAGNRNIYALAVAAEGSQKLFAREASEALKVVSTRFAQDYRGGVLLSNGSVDILHRPMATQGNFARAARRIGDKIESGQDIAFVYFASHGGRDATLSTGLPNYDSLTPISARSVASALAGTGIRRRIFVISACFSATWIPALATDDTIVITAAAKDRTSFGCDDNRRLTYFGQAFLDGPFAQGASLHEAFDAARRAVARWEKQDNATPSMPQVYVGRNMQSIWEERAADRKDRPN